MIDFFSSSILTHTHLLLPSWLNNLPTPFTISLSRFVFLLIPNCCFSLITWKDCGLLMPNCVCTRIVWWVCEDNLRSIRVHYDDKIIFSRFWFYIFCISTFMEINEALWSSFLFNWLMILLIAVFRFIFPNTFIVVFMENELSSDYSCWLLVCLCPLLYIICVCSVLPNCLG